MATMTANSIVAYSDVVFKQSYDAWVQAAHKFNCEHNGWTFHPLKPGAYGYDSIVVSLHHAFNNSEFAEFLAQKNVEAIASLIHDGWAINYRYWVTNEPYNTNVEYMKPFNPINDERRNICAQTLYHELQPEEKEKDYVFATFLLHSLCTP
jgi:hypothetical protein